MISGRPSALRDTRKRRREKTPVWFWGRKQRSCPRPLEGETRFCTGWKTERQRWDFSWIFLLLTAGTDSTTAGTPFISGQENFQAVWTALTAGEAMIWPTGSGAETFWKRPGVSGS